MKFRSVSLSGKFKSICLRCSYTLIFLLFLQAGNAQYDFSGVDGLLQRNLKLLGGSISALVYKDGKIIYQKDFGEFNAKTKAPIASAGKWIAAAVIMTLVDEGKLSLDDPVSKYIPLYDKYMKSYVTLRHCLSHTTGIENDKKLAPKKRYQTLEDEVNAYAAKEISNNPGMEFHYGGIGLNIAGRVAEIVSKKSFDRLAQEKILRPLKMKGTTFTDDAGMATNPSGGAWSTANDYMNFLIMIMNKGMFEGKRILSEEAIAEMQKPQFTELPVKYTPKIAEGLNYGLGEWIEEKDDKGNAVVISSPGLFGSWPFIDKCRGYAAIILVNKRLGEQKKDIYTNIKAAIDEQLKSDCR